MTNVQQFYLSMHHINATFHFFNGRTSTSPQREPPGPLLQYTSSHHVPGGSIDGRLAITSGNTGGVMPSNALTFPKDYGEDTSDRMNQKRREQYRQVRAHVQKEDGRLHAYGWSLPGTKTNPTGTPKTDRKMPKVPVPVYCRPLAEASPHMKVFCAAGVNLNGGYTKDGGCIVSVSHSVQQFVPSHLPCLCWRVEAEYLLLIVANAFALVF